MGKKYFKIFILVEKIDDFGIKLGTRKIDKACQVVIGVLCVIIHSVPAVMTLNKCNTVLSDVEKDLKYILSIFCILSFSLLSFILKFNS